jgi:hypothetical protein
VLGGSRADGTHRPDSDWDLGLFYRASDQRFEPGTVRALGHPGYVSRLGEWGPIVHGGAWLTIDGMAVDVLFRDLDRVEAWIADAEEGRYAVLTQNGYVVGAPTYLPVGELTTCVPVAGASLPRPGFPDALAAAAPARWAGRASVSLMFAGTHARAGDAACCAGMLRRRHALRRPRAAVRAPRMGAQREAPRRARRPRRGAAVARERRRDGGRARRHGPGGRRRARDRAAQRALRPATPPRGARARAHRRAA